jgi:hypothetical protein
MQICNLKTSLAQRSYPAGGLFLVGGLRMLAQYISKSSRRLYTGSVALLDEGQTNSECRNKWDI